MRKITRWINEKFSVSLTDKDYNGLTEFLLLWNLFEDRLFENNFRIEKAERYIDDYIGEFNSNECNKVFKYFKNRYTNVDLGIITYPTFEKLNFRANDRKEFVDDVLVTESPSLRDKILASIIIIFRYRNNLFHGLKDVTQINYQQSNLVTANKMLKMFIETKV
ncbi:hypothetical protein J8L04_17010 [Bacteroides fragilis]|jgi:hypothetical protein|uniref:Apea-like HEPN domain-containing protein n=1 Tax=Bacteroides fragilis TaxID=817 RepID=A0A0I9SBJ7_BACFG|nr:hypothetical protein [Bacteroides fragilis]MCM0228816.1 hypothetical protein [Bacteroides fragilis]QCQ50791.1 hypothetical protein EE52_016035 [Bacteroides fragilis]